MRTISSLWLRCAIALAVSLPLIAAPVQEAAAGDGATRPDGNDKPDQPGKKPAGKKGKGGKGKDGKGKGKDKKGPKGKGPFEKDEYPVAQQFRPLVLPNGMGQITVMPAYLRDNVPLVGGEDYVTTDVDFTYGLGDLVELGIGSGLQWAPEVDWTSRITAHVHWLAVDTKDFDLAPGVVVPFDFEDGASQSVQLDAYGRYLFADKFFLTFGRHVFDIAVNPDFGLTFNANGGLGFQASREAVLWLDTTVLTVPLAPDVDVTGPWEQLNVSIGGQYSPSRYVDLGLALSYGDTWELAEESQIGAALFGKFRF